MILLSIFITKILLASSACPYGGGNIGPFWGCLSSKMIDSKVCTSSCPSRFASGKTNGIVSWCFPPSVNNATIFDLQFSSIKDLTLTNIPSSIDANVKFQNPGSISYNSPTKNSPLPTIDRGFYFATTSSITGGQSLVPGCYFTLNIWIKPLESGEILNVISGSDTYIRIWADASGVYKLTIYIYNSNNSHITQTVASTSSYTSSWHTASMIINQSTCDTANISFYINGINAGNTAFTSTETRFPIVSYDWTIGNANSLNSFRGFLYWLQTRADCTQSTAALTISIECIDNQYYDGSCHNCDSNCPTWPWCVRATDCIPCEVIDCNICQGYPPLTCITCNTGVGANCCDHLGAACTQTWTNSGCNSGNFLIGNVCLYECPYGFGNCAAVSTAVLTADFAGVFAGSYGTALITATSSSSYNYWSSPNSPESFDPFPAKNRGLYFNSNQYLSGSISLSNTWSMALWVYAISGTILSHSTNKLVIDSSGTVTFYLEKWDGSVSPTSYSAAQSISTYTWTYISYSVSFANKASTMIPYLNNAAGALATAVDYIFRLPPAGTLYLGKGSSNFNGFIAYFILWQVTISDFSAYYSINTLTGGSVSVLWPCDYSQYYDGSVCQSCLDSTCTIGCIRGTSCYICDDFLCSQCSSFLPGACTLCIPNASGSPCSCNSGFYQPTNQALCSACYSGCSHCTGSSYHLCTSCSSSYFTYKSVICLADCPTGHVKNTGTGNCDLSEVMPLSLSFNNEILLDQISGKQIGSSFSNSYPTYDSNDPIPAYLRGYYFNSNSYLTTMFMLAPNFSISLWIKAESSGIVIIKYVSTTQWFVQILSSGYPKLSLLLMDTVSTVSVIGSSSVLNNWFFVSFDGKTNSDGTTTISSYIDAASQVTSTSLSPLFLLDSKTGSFYIGLYSGSFTGFLWELKFFSENNHALDDWKTSGCSGGCSKCPIDSICPDNCPLSQYCDGSPCSNCISTCSKGCRNSDSCNLCKTKECATCTEFTGSNSCLTCITNAISDGNGGCTCAANAFWVSSTQTCDLCDTLCSTCLKTAYFECSACSGSQLIGSVCLNECPYSTSCSTVTSPVIDLSFDADFQGSYGIFTTGANAATFQFSSGPETIDPIPAYKRGLYFDGTMYLLSSATVYLSHSFSIGVWLYVIIDGDLLQKQTFLTIESTGLITATIVDHLQAASTQTLAPGSSFTGWAYLSVTFGYSLGSTTLTIYINGVSSSTVSAANKIYRDQASTYLMLGKSNNPGIIGFLYYFQLWNTPLTDFLTIINSFTFCDSGQVASCLWTCDLSSYINGASPSACNSCSYGCRRANSCNICDDTLCIACTGFDSGKCTQCDPSVTLSSGFCLCNAGFGRSADGLTCAACFTGCSLCLAVTYNKCTACNSGLYFFANTGQCLIKCPSGYTTGTNTCDYVTNLGISLDLTDQVRLDTVSGFDVGSSNLNTYPDWSDLNDPMPSYKRGYYFYLSNYLSASVIIAPSFTISLWIKPLDLGIVMVKYTTSEILKIEVNSSFQPSITIFFADGSSETLAASTNIRYNWHFLSFTGQVQADGKTALNIYIDNAASSSSTTTTAFTYFKDTDTGKLYVGNDSSFGTAGLYGFLARLKIYNSNTYRSNDYATSTCGAGCSSCPSNNQCLSDCAVNEYPDSCTTCLSACSE